MWYGKDTLELIALKEKYKKITGYDPDGEMDLEYNDKMYHEYVDDLKLAIKRKCTLADLFDQ